MGKRGRTAREPSHCRCREIALFAAGPVRLAWAMTIPLHGSWPPYRITAMVSVMQFLIRCLTSAGTPRSGELPHIARASWCSRKDVSPALRCFRFCADDTTAGNSPGEHFGESCAAPAATAMRFQEARRPKAFDVLSDIAFLPSQAARLIARLK